MEDNTERKDHISWQYENSKTQQQETMYFAENSRIGGYIKNFKSSDSQNPAVAQIITELANLKENDPGNTKAITAKEAKLILVFGRKLDKWKDFDFNTHPEFSALVTTCTDDELNSIGKYLDNPALQSNKYNLTVSIKLFFSNRKKDTNTPALQKEFLAILENILENPELADTKKQREATKLAMMAAGIWNETAIKKRKKVRMKDETLNANTKKSMMEIRTITTPYSKLDLDQYPTLCKILTDPKRCKEKDMEKDWFKDFVQATLHYPNEYNFMKYDDFSLAIHIPPLGEGAFGAVHKALRVNKDKQLIVAQPYAAKISKNSQGKITLEEFQAEAAYSKTSGLTKTLKPKELNYNYAEEYVLPLPFITGQDFSDNDFTSLAVFLKEASLSERAKLARELDMAVTNLHKLGILHGDIKGANIRLNKRQLKNGNFVYDVTPIDFGLSASLKKINSDGSIFHKSGTPHYMAPEILQKRQAYANSDHFSSTPLYMAIFGAKNPLTQKNNIKIGPGIIYAIINEPYVKTGMMNDDIKIKSENHAYINDCLINMTEQRLDKNPLTRADDNKILIFNNNFYAYAKMAEMTLEELKKNGLTEEIFNLHGAKCILISQGLWDTAIDGILKFGDIDYALYPKISAAIVKIYKECQQDPAKKFKNLLMIEMTLEKLKENGLTEEDFNLYGTKCILTSQRLWDTTIDGILKFGDIDYSLYPKISAAIVKTYKECQLDSTKILKESLIAAVFLAAVESTDESTGKRDSFNQDIVNNIVTNATTSSSWYSTNKKSDAKECMKHMPLEAVNKLINERTDQKEINKLTQLALSRDNFDSTFVPTGKFKNTIAEIAKSHNKPSFFFIQKFFETSTYREYDNAKKIQKNQNSATVIRRKIPDNQEGIEKDNLEKRTQETPTPPKSEPLKKTSQEQPQPSKIIESKAATKLRLPRPGLN